MIKDNYFFGEKDSETKRLDLLNQVYSVYSKKFIETQLTQHPGKLLEIGCGRGTMLEWLSRQPFVHSVVGIDIDQRAIDFANAKKISNAELEVLSVYDLDQLTEQFDFIYQRFVLIHLTNPMAAIRAIYNQLKPGGFFICETCIHSHCFSDPISPGYDRFIKLAIQMFASQGKDGDIGKHLISQASQVGFQKIAAELHQPLLTTASEKNLMVLGLQNARNLFIQENLHTEAELNKVEQNMLIDLNNNHCFWAAPTFCQFLLRKP